MASDPKRATVIDVARLVASSDCGLRLMKCAVFDLRYLMGWEQERSRILEGRVLESFLTDTQGTAKNQFTEGCLTTLER